MEKKIKNMNAENIKTGDVFSFRYNEEYVNTHHSPYHCFDGQLIANVDDNGGDVYLIDTYWSSGNKTFTLDKALKEGTLKFRFNINDVVNCYESDKAYYKDTDIFDFSYQHGCHKRFVRKKDAKRDKAVMLKSLRNVIQELESQLRYTEIDLTDAKKTMKDIEEGKSLEDIYIP